MRGVQAPRLEVGRLVQDDERISRLRRDAMNDVLDDRGAGSVEAEDRALRDEYLKTMIEYKYNWEQRIEEARALGRPEPRPTPHPDDVIVDPHRIEAHVLGGFGRFDNIFNAGERAGVRYSHAKRYFFHD